MAALSCHMDRLNLLLFAAAEAALGLDVCAVLVDELEKVYIALLSSDEGWCGPHSARMVLSLIDIDAAVPRVILFPVLIELLVIEEQFDDFFAAALASDVEARSLVLFTFLVRNTNLTELVDDVVVALETCVV